MGDAIPGYGKFMEKIPRLDMQLNVEKCDLVKDANDCKCTTHKNTYLMALLTCALQESLSLLAKHRASKSPAVRNSCPRPSRAKARAEEQKSSTNCCF